MVLGPENYTLAFFPDGTYYIKADCDRGSGNYTLEVNSLNLGPATITLIGCGPDSTDSKYLELLSNVKSAAFENGQLILYSENAGDRMFFTNGGLSRKFNRKLILALGSLYLQSFFFITRVSLGPDLLEFD